MQSSPDDDQLLKTGAAADVLAVSPTTFRRLVLGGYLTPVRCGPRGVRYRASDVQAFIAAGGVR